jgi:hypothetical protein
MGLMLLGGTHKAKLTASFSWVRYNAMTTKTKGKKPNNNQGCSKKWFMGHKILCQRLPAKKMPKPQKNKLVKKHQG